MPVPFSILGLDHVVVRARDIDTMLAFYRDILGCALERTVADIGLYQLRAGRTLIDLVDCAGELGRKGGPPPGPDGHNMDHLCLRIEPWSAAAIHAHMDAHGIAAGPESRRNGAEGMGPSIYVTDPEGNTVELKGPAES